MDEGEEKIGILDKLVGRAAEDFLGSAARKPD